MLLRHMVLATGALRYVRVARGGGVARGAQLWCGFYGMLGREMDRAARGQWGRGPTQHP